MIQSIAIVRKTAAVLALLAGSHLVSLTAQESPPVKVFLLAGQSNMQGHGFVDADPDRYEGKGSLESLVRHKAAAESFDALMEDDGTWRERKDVWIHFLQRKGPLSVGYGARPDRIGPELGFGWMVGNHFEEPVLLIKLAWGGKSLAEDFRPPSAEGATGPYYEELIQRTKNLLNHLGEEFPELQDREPEVVGFGWHQGWNDRVNQAFNDEYESNLAHFIRDIRKDLGVPKLPFVIAETGMKGHEDKHPRALSLQRAQAAVAEYDEFQGNVAFVGTKDFYRPPEESPTRQGYHWNSNAETYYLIGEAMGRAMLDLLERKSRVGFDPIVRDIEGWRVHVDPALIHGPHRAMGDGSLQMLANHLQRIKILVPKHALRKLQQIEIWIEYKHPQLGAMQYHPSREWLVDHGYDPRLAKKVHITRAEELLSRSQMLKHPAVILHELAHAYHDQVLGFDDETILKTYEQALESGVYEDVLLYTGKRVRHYGLTNHKEYFAEGTEAYFYRNDFYPFVRAELEEHDPELHQVLREAWGEE